MEGVRDVVPAAAAVQLTGVCKSFGPVRANNDINLRIAAGSIHGIVGENGAGKSTLMSILYGFYTADSGTVEIFGRQVDIRNSSTAIDLGIGMVHQHFMLVPVFSVLENVLLGVEGGALLTQGRRHARKELARLGRDYGLKVDPDELVKDLPSGVQQRVEILKALYRGAKILILDEPTGVLTPQEADRLFEILATLRERGTTVILITHKLREIMAITDNVTVMREGRVVAERKTSETSPEDLAEQMVGRKVLLQIGKQPQQAGEPKMEVRNLDVMGNNGVLGVRQASFTLHAGEILGVAGVCGNGQSELIDALSGIKPLAGGSIRVGGREITADKPATPAQVHQLGVAHVPEDRQERGLVLKFSAEDSLILGRQGENRYCRINGLFLDRGAIRRNASVALDEFDVRPPDPLLRSAGFSGGNQQKIVLAREIRDEPEVFLVGQPTRGVDIGAIEAIHRRLLALRAKGCAILLVSFELDEVMSLADRIIVMNAGAIVGEVEAAKTDERELGLLMAGVGRDG